MAELNIDTLKAKFNGKIIQSEDDQYDSARKTYVSKRAFPALIVQPSNNEDIAEAITFAKDNELELSIHSGGHGVAGLSASDKGMMLDLSGMNAIKILDQDKGLVRIGSGAVWGDVAKELGKYNLGISSGDTTSVGVGGLVLGGGIGWMVRKYGYTIDSLVAADMVLADGSIVRVSESEHSDLFWAVRGGGGNVGVVSSFEFEAHPLTDIVESTVVYDVTNLKQVITGWRDTIRKSPEELTSFLTLMPGFMGLEPQAMAMSCYANNDLGTAKKLLSPLLEIPGMKTETMEVKAYADVLQEAHPPKGMKFIVKNMYAKKLSTELITALSDICCRDGSPIIQLRIMSGAADRIDNDATALAHRGNELFLFVGLPLPITASKEDEAESLKAWERLATFSTGTYANFISTTSDEDIASVYPEKTYKRLATLKKQYDPENIFHRNFNVKPLK